MARRTTPNQQHARNEEFSDKTVERFQNYAQQALNHGMGRNARVVKVLCYTSLLRSAGNIPMGSSVNVSAAEFQNYKSTGGNQAAHYLPGQLKINGKNLSEWSSSQQGKTQISTMFADVEDLPADFNKADTQAEASGQNAGLCAAFAAAVSHVVQCSQGVAAINRRVVAHAYDAIWINQARNACNLALSKKAEKYQRPAPVYGSGHDYGNIMNLDDIEDAKNESRFHHQQDILRHYVRSLSERPRELNDHNLAELEKNWPG